MHSPELIETIRHEEILKQEDFQTEFNRRVYCACLDACAEQGGIEEGLLSERFTPEEMGRIVGMKVRRTGLTNNGKDVLRECIARLKATRTKGNNIEDIEDILGAKRRKKNEQ